MAPGTGFLDQDDTTTIGPTYDNLDTEATPTMVADCNTFVEEHPGLLCDGCHHDNSCH